jgi:hypothetical protein
MVYKPHVEVLAELMKTCLSRAQFAMERFSVDSESVDRTMKVAQ